MRKLLVVLALGLAVTACAAPDAPDPEPNLFGEYLKAIDVKNDRLPSAATSEDRMANLAAYYEVDQLAYQLLAAFPCTTEDTSDTSSGGDVFDTTCDLNDDVMAQVDTADDVNGRVILVKHDDGELELLTVFVAGGKLIDSTGRTYTSLDDFRANNELLTSDDVIVAPREILKVPGEGTIVTVYGHTATNWTPWLVALGGLVVLVIVGVVLVRRRRPAREFTDRPADEPTESTLD